jgi:hypothetical protein
LDCIAIYERTGIPCIVLSSLDIKNDVWSFCYYIFIKLWLNKYFRFFVYSKNSIKL